jgi:hypothetical protein
MATSRGVLAAVLGIAIAAAIAVPPAAADRIDARAKQLRSARAHETRLSAAIWLSRSDDARAVAALTAALRRDGEPTIRNVAAVALGRLVDTTMPADVRDAAIDALAYAARRDGSETVRRSASASHASLRSLRTPAYGLPPIFVAVGRPTDRSARLSRLGLAAVDGALRRALRATGSELAQTAPGEDGPSSAELRQSGTLGFFVNASVAQVQVARGSGRAEVRCQVDMRVSGWNGHDGGERFQEGQSASATGRGRVVSGLAARQIALAAQDCATGVVEEVTARQIVPFMRRQAATTARVASRRKRVVQIAAERE